MGSCDLALTNDDQALHDFELARDYDALDFRADTRINSAIQGCGIQSRRAECPFAGCRQMFWRKILQQAFLDWNCFTSMCI